MLGFKPCGFEPRCFLMSGLLPLRLQLCRLSRGLLAFGFPSCLDACRFTAGGVLPLDRQYFGLPRKFLALRFQPCRLDARRFLTRGFLPLGLLLRGRLAGDLLAFGLVLHGLHQCGLLACRLLLLRFELRCRTLRGLFKFGCQARGLGARRLPALFCFQARFKPGRGLPCALLAFGLQSRGLLLLCRYDDGFQRIALRGGGVRRLLRRRGFGRYCRCRPLRHAGVLWRLRKCRRRGAGSSAAARR